jgi:transcriptional regulator with XRE-family HTH domain
VSRQPRQLSRYLAEAEQLGRVLREARAEAGMTQIEVAELSGVPYSTLRAIERAHVKEPCFFAVMDICAVIGIKPAKLVTLFGRRRRSARSRKAGAIAVVSDAMVSDRDL